jgi:hypothetical protein
MIDLTYCFYVFYLRSAASQAAAARPGTSARGTDCHANLKCQIDIKNCKSGPEMPRQFSAFGRTQ